MRAESSSSIDVFKTCPKKYEGQYVTGEFKQQWGQRSPDQIAGLRLHDAFETALLHGVSLPPQYAADPYIAATHKRILAISKKMNAVIEPEKQLAIDTHFNPTEYWDDNTAFRGALDIDMVSEDGQIGYLGDLKNGKDSYMSPAQLDRYACMLFANSLGLKRIIAEYHYIKTQRTYTFYYAKNKKEQQLLIDKHPKAKVETETAVQDQLTYELQLIQRCHETGNWVAKKNGLCKNYCPRTDCQFNGK